jgi:hypothetical protein
MCSSPCHRGQPDSALFVASAEENTMDILPVPNLELSLLMLNWLKGKMEIGQTYCCSEHHLVVLGPLCFKST